MLPGILRIGDWVAVGEDVDAGDRATTCRVARGILVEGGLTDNSNLDKERRSERWWQALYSYNLEVLK